MPPIIPLALGGGFWIANHYFLHLEVSGWIILAAMAGFWGIGSVVIFVASAISGLLEDEIEKFSVERNSRSLNRKWEAQKKLKVRQAELVKMRYEAKYGPIVCAGVPLKASVNALPKTHRTYYLRFLGFKAEVCRPFARN